MRAGHSTPVSFVAALAAFWVVVLALGWAYYGRGLNVFLWLWPVVQNASISATDATLYMPGCIAGVAVWSFLRRSVRVADGELHCPACGYTLRGLSQPRCPECGRAI